MNNIHIVKKEEYDFSNSINFKDNCKVNKWKSLIFELIFTYGYISIRMQKFVEISTLRMNILIEDKKCYLFCYTYDCMFMPTWHCQDHERVSKIDWKIALGQFGRVYYINAIAIYMHDWRIGSLNLKSFLIFQTFIN